MKMWNIKVGFVGGTKKVLYVKHYQIKAETQEIAELILFNGLSMLEFRNFDILETKEIEKC
jgi:hypothetical protein